MAAQDRDVPQLEIPLATTVRCTSCKALMFWVLSPKNARMPLDAAPIARADLKRGTVPYVVDFTTRPNQAQAAPDDASLVYVSHFTTCDSPARFSSKAAR